MDEVKPYAKPGLTQINVWIAWLCYLFAVFSGDLAGLDRGRGVDFHV